MKSSLSKITTRKEISVLRTHTFACRWLRFWDLWLPTLRSWATRVNTKGCDACGLAFACGSLALADSHRNLGSRSTIHIPNTACNPRLLLQLAERIDAKFRNRRICIAHYQRTWFGIGRESPLRCRDAHDDIFGHTGVSVVDLIRSSAIGRPLSDRNNIKLAITGTVLQRHDLASAS